MELLRQVRVHEPAATAGIRAIAAEVGCRADGLQYRLKSPQSLARKIRKRQTQSPNVPVADLAGEITDAQRYTLTAEAQDDIVPTARKALEALVERGWIVLEVEHSYVPDNPYKGLHALLRSPAGISTEVQFHSTAGLELKEVSHLDYTITRDTDRPLRDRLAADQRMRGRYGQLAAPRGLAALRTLAGVPVGIKAYPGRGRSET